MDHRPVRLDLAAVALLGPGVLVQQRFERRVRHVIGQRASSGRWRQSASASRAPSMAPAPSAGDLMFGDPGRSQTQNLAHMAHGNSPRWHQSAPRPQPKSRPYAQPARLPSSPRTGRHHPESWRGLIGMLAAINRNRGAPSSRNGWAACPGITSCVQIDYWPYDVEIVDDNYRIPIGRPWLAMAIDTHTCMPNGLRTHPG